MKHTPGPWRISKFGKATGKQLTVMGDDGYGVCWIDGRSPEEHMADAQLIAAAPDLLEALKAVWERHAGELPDGVLVKAAIAKAEGRA